MGRKIIVFGASEGGRKFLNNQNEYEILAFTDNNQSKIGSYIEQFPIIAPDRLSDYAYDFIVIASMYIKEIKVQLIHELKINEEKIIIAPKAQLKESYRPFEHEATYLLAKRTLSSLVKTFNSSKVEYFVEFGTLLGLIREGDIIRWDDDIDISILSNEYGKVMKLLEGEIVKISIETGVEWEYQTRINDNDNPRSIVLLFNNINGEFKSFTVSITLIYFSNGNAIQPMNCLPELHYRNFETIKYENNEVRVPFNYIGYLEATYGDWKTPQKNLTYGDYKFVYEQGF